MAASIIFSHKINHHYYASGEAHDGGGHVVGVYLYSVRASNASPLPLKEYSAHARECGTFSWSAAFGYQRSVLTWSRVDLHKGQFYNGYVRIYVCLFSFSVRRGFLRNWRMNFMLEIKGRKLAKEGTVRLKDKFKSH